MCLYIEVMICSRRWPDEGHFEHEPAAAHSISYESSSVCACAASRGLLYLMAMVMKHISAAQTNSVGKSDATTP